MAAGSVTIADDGTETTSGLAGDIYAQRKAALLLVEPPGQVPTGAAGATLKKGLALDANAIANAIFGANGGGMPTGAVIPFAGTSTPTGFLFCDGQAVSRTVYATLFAAIGVVYGVGDGSTTFNLPDLRGRFPLGANYAGLPNGENVSFTPRSVAATAGTETHTLGTAEMPAHAHGSTGLVHSTPGSGTLTISAGLDFDDGGATSNVGGGGAHNNMPPLLALNFLIKV